MPGTEAKLVSAVPGHLGRKLGTSTTANVPSEASSLLERQPYTGHPGKPTEEEKRAWHTFNDLESESSASAEESSTPAGESITSADSFGPQRRPRKKQIPVSRACLAAGVCFAVVLLACGCLMLEITGVCSSERGRGKRREGGGGYSAAKSRQFGVIYCRLLGGHIAPKKLLGEMGILGVQIHFAFRRAISHLSYI